MAKQQAKSIANEARLSEELKAMQWEPLLPVEKKLITWSIALGIVLARAAHLGKLYLLPKWPLRRRAISFWRLITGQKSHAAETGAGYPAPFRKQGR